MAKYEITRIKDFSKEAYLENINYGILNDELIESDLLLLPFSSGNTNEDPVFLRGSYDRLKRFKNDYAGYNIQPIFKEDVKPRYVIFNDISIYLGTFIVTSILAPIFVNWISSKISTKDKESVNINITINVYDKGDDVCTRFKHYDNLDHYQHVFIKDIEEYSALKAQGKLKIFDEKHLGKSIDFKA